MKQIHQTPCTLQRGGKFTPSGGIEDVIPAKKRSPSGKWTPVKDLSEEYFVRASERRQYGVKRAGRRATRNVAPIGHSGDYLTRSAGRAEGRGRTVMGLSTTCRTSRRLNPLQCIPTAPLFVLERRTRLYTETATHMPENIGTIACTVWQVQTPGVEVVVAQ